MKELLRKNLLLIIVTFAGAIGGFLYWKFVGCITGTCPIKSVWYLSTLYGALIGFLGGSIVHDVIIKFRKKKKSDQDSQS